MVFGVTDGVSLPAAGQNGRVDRRVPYYVLEGCDYMLDAGAACQPDGTSLDYPLAIACCPIGFECKQAGNSQVRALANAITMSTSCKPFQQLNQCYCGLGAQHAQALLAVAFH